MGNRPKDFEIRAKAVRHKVPARRTKINVTMKMNARRRSVFSVWGACLAISASLGCSSNPSAVNPPKYDPHAFADSLLQRFDADGDGSLSKKESELAPGLLARWTRYDASKDGVVTREELESHAQIWVDRGDGISSITCVVRLNNRQIGDVSVRLTPDESLKEIIKPAETVSHSEYASFLSIPAEFKSEAHAKLTGMQYGLYHVEVTHPTMSLVPSANSRGVDVSPADQAAPIAISVERK